jgi:N-acetylglucosaminyldiphosphoundecaprenol N-acetyl-beta-D-mannosaminyltransferase
MESPLSLHTVSILGVEVDDVTEGDALDILVRFIEGGDPHRVVTPNPEIVMLAQSDPGYRALLNSSDLRVPDGIGLLLASAAQGNRLKEHVRATDLVLRLASISPAHGWRWFLLGAAPGVAEEAGTWLAQRFPGLQIAGAASGSPDPASDLELREAIRAVAPVHELLVAYGAPKQERWIARNQAAIGVPAQVGVGGVLDFFSGRVPRAPEWLRQIELEWAYRLVNQPWRWRRQLALPTFAALALAEGLGRLRRGG